MLSGDDDTPCSSAMTHALRQGVAELQRGAIEERQVASQASNPAELACLHVGSFSSKRLKPFARLSRRFLLNRHCRGLHQPGLIRGFEKCGEKGRTRHGDTSGLKSRGGQ